MSTNSMDNRVQTLQNKHAEIDAEIQTLSTTPAVQNISELKKAKLAIKDEISRLQKEVRLLAV